MSAEDKRIQYIIETIDKTSGGLDAANTRINALDKEVKQLNASTNKLNSSVDRVGPKMKSAMGESFSYGKKLNGQLNELAMRFIGITAGVQVVRYLGKALIDAGLDTKEFDKNLGAMSATIGTALMPTAEKAMKWFNENYQVITQTAINFGKVVSVVFNGLASLPVGAAAAFYKIRPIIDAALGIRGEALEKSKREAETLGKSYAESFKAEIDKLSTTIGSMSEMPKMVQPKTTGDKKQEFNFAGLPSQGNIKFAIQEAQKQVEAQQKITEQIRSITDEHDKALIQAAAENGQKLYDLKQATIESEIALEQDKFAQMYAETQMWYSNELSQYATVAGAKTEIDIQYANKKKAIAAEESQYRIDLEKKTRDMQVQNFVQIGGAFNNLMGAIGEATKENAKAQKAIAIVQAVINTALGVTQAIAQGGVAGIVTGALVAAAGAVQIATIASQNFALGGVAKRVPGAVSDSVNVNVNPDERIVTKRQQNNLTRFLNNPNQGGGQSTVINIYDYAGDLIDTIIKKSKEGDERLAAYFRSRYVTA